MNRPFYPCVSYPSHLPIHQTFKTLSIFYCIYILLGQTFTDTNIEDVEAITPIRRRLLS